MQSIAEYLERLNSLTQQNLDILKTINDSFFTKKEHLVVNVEDNHYVIPSFISLENKINALQESFDNIVNAPATGEAYFNYDGNSKTIQVRGFNNTPHEITLDTDNTDKFYVKDNSIFKDFITPDAHLRFDLTSIPDDISTVIVKKVVPISNVAKELLSSYVTTQEKAASVNYRDLYKQLSILLSGSDYEEYDTIRQLPIRKSLGTGTYVITKIIKDEILSDLSEQLTLEISNKTELKYKKFDETIDVDLEPGMFLTTYNDRVKLQIVDVNIRNRQLVLKVVNGDYLDLVPYTTDFEDVNTVPDMSKLNFFSVNDFSKDKYIDVTLEEDQYIGIFVAPLNSRMNVQAPWGTGVIIDSYSILYADDNTKNYREFYEDNIRNIGDILKEIVEMTDNSITKYNQEEFNSFTRYVPTINTDNLDVVQINRHLNDSPTVQRIRSLYSQKKQYEIDLNELQTKITNVNNTLATVSFDDTTNLRTIYESQLDELTKKKNEIVSAINSTINEISLAVNESDVPIENAKYHIRGYFDWDVADTSDDETLKTYKNHVKGIRVEYRYKNRDQVTGTAESFQDGKFIYSDWNRMDGFYRMANPSCSETNTYSYAYPGNNDRVNEPSFNQIDIPITQGESVDIRLKIVWDFGYPYIETTSAWSEVTNIVFPEQYLKDIQILDIISENNSDIETNRFNNILIVNGIMDHVNDKQQDQDVLYFHKPEHIASGFYTDERRIIPLRDKLSTMDAAIVGLEDVVYGTNSENIKMEFIFDSTSTLIMPYQDNNVDVNVDVIVDEQSDVDLNEYNNIANLQITNVSNRTMRLYSIFPGNRDVPVINSNITQSNHEDEYNIGLFYNRQLGVTGRPSPMNAYFIVDQRRNQFAYLRSTDVYDHTTPIHAFVPGSTNTPLCTFLINNNISQISMDSNSTHDFKVLDPGESIIIPVIFSFVYENPNSNGDYKVLNSDLEMSIDIRMSLYNDPQNYFIKIHRVNEQDQTLHSKIIASQNNLTKYNSVIVKDVSSARNNLR